MKMELAAEMALEEGGTSLRGSETTMTAHQHLGIAITMVTDLSIAAEDGGRRIVMTERQIEAMTREATDVGTGIETNVKSVTLNGWTSLQMRRSRHIHKKTFKSGRKKCKGKSK
jgi:hypothetical protein